MNSGAEAVESAIKVARKWAYQVKGVPDEHRRDRRRRRQLPRPHHHDRLVLRPTRWRADDFGPFTPGFVVVKYGDSQALRGGDHAAHRRGADRADPGRGGRARAAGRLPAGGPAALRRAQRAVDRRRDPVRAGPHRRRCWRCDHEGVRADLYTLGKALGGGIMPVSAVVGRRDVLGVLRPGEHGSTFGGNPLACAIGRAVMRCWRPARSRRGPANSARTCTPGSASWSATGSPRSAAAGCGPASRSRPAGRAAARRREELAGAGRAVQGDPRHDAAGRAAAGDHPAELDHGIDTIAEVLAD